jgi:triphosphoribosyl-dephospho-CoA synthase CitG
MDMKQLISERALKISELAVKSMLYEVSSFPSPGLVSPFGPGVHRDMDYFTFLKSISVMFTPLAQSAQTGMDEEYSGIIMPRLRKIGINAEKRMYQATGGINTQKGQIFIHCILAAAAGQILRKNNPIEVPELFREVAAICEGLVEHDYENLHKKEKLTRGETLYLNYGITGIRGEAESGLPSVRKCGLPTLYEAKRAELSENDCAVHTLIAIMSCCDDTNIAGKFSPDTLASVKKRAGRVMDAGGMLSKEGRSLVNELDREFCEEGLSPGGAADLLAATFFVYFLVESFKI